MNSPPPLLATTCPPRRQFKLNAQSLTDTDIARVAAFLRVGAERLQCDWKIVADGEFHVLMLGGAEPTTVPGMLESPLATLRVVDAGDGRSDGPAILRRPLQYEDLLDALTEVERRFIRKPPALSRAVPMVPAQRRMPAVSAALAPGASYRLRRWPPSEMLQGDRYHQRLASFLSARHLDLGELARLSNVDRSQCEQFLIALDAAGLLNEKPAPANEPAVRAAPPTTATPAALQQPTHVPVPVTRAGFLSKIRSSLGMTWPR